MSNKYIKQALQLAKKADPSPNPQVGAILVKNGKIIGQGCHKKYGGPHAEVEAFNSCKGDPKGSTLYVTLEPCSHYGKTPPCTDLIIKKKVHEVVIHKLDPNPKVHGIEKLRKAGIKARVLNPYITLKIASSIDFKIWSPTQTKITGKKSRKLAHKMRAKSDAILVGIGTILQDNPRLDVRLVEGPNPAKIILDSHLRIPLNAKVLKEGKTIICTTIKKSQKHTKLEKLGAQILTFPTLKNLKKVMQKLTSLGYERILVEGGQKISTSFLSSGLVDELKLFIANKKLGETGLETISKGLPRLKIKKINKCNSDIVLEITGNTN